MMRKLARFRWNIFQSSRSYGSRRQLTTSTTSEAPVQLSYNIYEPPAGKVRPNPIFMTHGLLGSKQNWNTIAKAVARDTSRKVVCFDARNHGDSPHVEFNTYDDMAEDILLLVQQLQVDKFCLLGHSMGGRSVMTFALKYPEKMDKLVVVDVSPFSMAGDFRHMRAFLDTLSSIKFDSSVQLSEARKIADAKLMNVAKDPGIRAFLLTNLAKDPSGVYWKPNLVALTASLTELKKFPEQLLACKFTSPALFIRGGNSFYIPNEDVEQIQSIFVQSKVATIENSGHWPQADNPNKFIPVLVNFLNDESTSK